MVTKDTILSNSKEEWLDENIVAKIKKGTEVTVLDHIEEFYAGGSMIRYKVKLQNGAEGWVHSFELE